MPWKNGGGLTREIAAYPVGAGLDTFVWRVSVADVEQTGPFSTFEGVERTLVLLAGSGMRLLENGGLAHALTAPLAVARFDGAAQLEAQLIDGATRDFNLMVRRDRARAALHVWRDSGRHVLEADVALVFCAHGELALRLTGADRRAADVDPAQATLGPMDTLVLDAPRALRCDVKGEGAALAVLLQYL
jgi:environmental stress-induced protein Ves|nr:HutD family protein [Trinickia diaoshuihuensis]